MSNVTLYIQARQNVDCLLYTSSEAVTNAIVHGYEEHGGRIILEASLENGILEVVITDKGVGIEDVERAMQPMFTTRADSERSGMGFAFMEAFMDRVQVTSSPGEGTSVHMWLSLIHI